MDLLIYPADQASRGADACLRLYCTAEKTLNRVFIICCSLPQVVRNENTVLYHASRSERLMDDHLLFPVFFVSSYYARSLTLRRIARVMNVVPTATTSLYMRNDSN